MKKLNKFFVLVFAVLFMAGLGLAGCGKTASSVTVYAYNYNSASESWVEVAKKTVDAHNNLVLETPEAEPPAGKEFYGWSTSQNWQEGSSDFVIEGNYVSYNSVKNVATKGTIKLYPAYKTQVNYYFVFGVYTYETRSGITAENVGEIRTALLTYLETVQHATEDQLALVDVREYSDAGVADYGAKIMKKGDVDVFVGCGNNINTDGGVSIIAKSSSFSINGTTGRRFIILNDDDLTIAVYNWFQTYIHDNFDSAYTPVNYVKVECTVTYTLGANHHADAVAPAEAHVYNNHTITLPEGPAAAEGYVFAGWKVGEATELAHAGDEVKITGDVTIEAQYKSGNTVTYSTGAETRTAATSAPAAVSGLADGAEVTLPDAPAAKAGFVFAGWKVGDDAVLKAAGAKITVNEDVTVTAQYTVDATADLTVIIGYYVADASGFSDADPEPYISSVISALHTYLGTVGVATGYDNIEIRVYSGSVKTVAGPAVTADLNNGDNVGVVLGFGSNLKSQGGVDYEAHGTRQGNFNMGTKLDGTRYVYRLTDNAAANIIYDWMVTPGSTFVSAVVTPAA